MSTIVLGSKSFSTVPDVQGTPVLLNAGNTPSIQSGSAGGLPAAGIAGRLYITSDQRTIYRDSGAVWELISAPTAAVVLQAITGSIPNISGTTLIALANTTPLITAGTQIWTQTITPTSITSRINITFSIFVDTNTANRAITVPVFRGSTCIGVATTSVATIARGIMLSMNIDDIPGVTTATTYSARVGTSSAATWFVNQGSTAIFNGMLALNGYTIMEFV